MINMVSPPLTPSLLPFKIPSLESILKKTPEISPILLFQIPTTYNFPINTKNFKTPKENEKHKLLNIQKSERETCRVIDERKQVEQGEREKKKGTLV